MKPDLALTHTAAAPRVPRGGLLAFLVRATAVGLASAAVAWLHSVHDPGVLCPLRWLTGVPCPLCGSTTVFIELGSGSLRGSLAANPVTFVAASALVAAPLGPGRWWWRSPYRLREALLVVAVTVSWFYQLARFGLLPL